MTEMDPNSFSALSQNIFQFLGIAIAIATFIPTLIYGYSRNLIDDIREGNLKTGNKKMPIAVDEARNIASFIYAIDLLVTQTMALVIVTSLSGLWTYICFVLWIQLYGSINSAYSIGLIIIFIFYLYLLYRSDHAFCIKLKDKFNYERWWPTWFKYRKVFLVLGIYVFVQIGFSIKLLCNCYCSNATNYSCEVLITSIMICLSTLLLVIAAVSWIFPLSSFNPLTNNLKGTLKKQYPYNNI